MSKFFTVDFSLQDCKVYKFTSKFKRSFGICKAVEFVNKAFDLFPRIQMPIKFLFTNMLGNTEMKF